MSGQRSGIQRFWAWFQSNQARLDALTDTSDPFWDEALGQLKQLDPRLWFEVSRANGGDREFIVTAEGHTDAFPFVEAIVAGAPQISGWRFVALKPPMGFDFITTYEGIRFEPRAMWFLPLESDSHAHDIGLCVGVPNFSPEIKRQATNAVLAILDTALGERAAALDIQHVEVSTLPQDPDTAGYIKLYELPTYIEWRKGKNQEA